MKTVSIDQAKIKNRQDIRLIDRLARATVFKLFREIKVGHLILVESGEQYSFGEDKPSAEIVAKINVSHPSAYRQVLLRGSIGSGESYMVGAWSSPDLINVVRLMVRNQALMQAMNGRWSVFKNILFGFTKYLQRNNINGSQTNISAHYDLSNDFFKLFLDKNMMYSSAVFESDDDTLEQASINKMRQVCRALNLSKDDHLLEIGTGWGGLAIFAAKTTGCRVTTTTISKEQYEYAKAWVKREGLENQITVVCKDYRVLSGKYDKIVSIEMIEAVGHKYYSSFFETCSQMLHEDGLMLIQAITMPDQKYDQARRSVDFIQKYIFPGGALPSIEVITQHVRKNTNMQIVSLADMTRDYALTLASWRHHFLNNLDKVRSLGFDSVFERMWEYYLLYCQGGFQERVIGTAQILMAKPDARDFSRTIRTTY